MSVQGENPLVKVEAKTFICTPHQWDLWRVFEGRIPNSIQILILVSQEMFGREEISNAAGGDVEALTGVLAEYGPGCCYIGEPRYMELLRQSASETGPATTKMHCGNCPHTYAVHTPYKGRGIPWGRCEHRDCQGFVPRDERGGAA